MKYGLKEECSEYSRENLSLLAKISDQIHFYLLKTFYMVVVRNEMGVEKILEFVIDCRYARDSM